MSDDLDNSFDMNGNEAPPPPPTSSNRNFMLAAGILGGLFLLALILLALFVTVIRPRMVAQRDQENALILQANTQTVSAMTQAAQAAFTSTPRPATASPTAAAPTATSVVAQATATTAATTVSEVDPRTATVAALLTQAAQAKLTATFLPSGTGTKLPATGFADEVGLPGMLGVAALLIVVIFLTRRLRTPSAV